jgi:hypothetical protein
MMAMTGNHTAMATADTVRLRRNICLHHRHVILKQTILLQFFSHHHVHQVFLKHVDADGALHNAIVQPQGACATVPASNAKAAGPELDVMMTSGACLASIALRSLGF